MSRHDYDAFVQILQEATEAWNLKVSAYCLMANHYHLLVQTPDGNIARCMRHVNGVYTQRFNRHHGKDGQLFRGRYKAVLIDADNYLLEVLRYIHRNPLQAGITASLQDFEWSSHHGYLTRDSKWDWLHKEILLSMLSAKESKRRSAYIDLVANGSPDEIERFYTLKNLPSILGAESFKEWVSDAFNQYRFHEEIPESRALAPSPVAVIDCVCEHFKVTREQLSASRRGTENLPRDIAMYLVRLHCRELLDEIGRHFGITKYSTVSSGVERIKTRKKQDHAVQKHLGELERMLAKGQRQT